MGFKFFPISKIEFFTVRMDSVEVDLVDFFVETVLKEDRSRKFERDKWMIRV